jgi:single-strand DNA-binding protein
MDNIVTVVGNLTADPELRFTSSGTAVANFTVASTPRVFDRVMGEWRDGETLFLRCSVWRQTAENMAESLQRGTRVIVCGRLREQRFETREGEKRTSVELAVDEVGMSLRYIAIKLTKTPRTQPEDMNGSKIPVQGSGGADGTAVTRGEGKVMDESMTADPCPSCGEGRGLRWCDSSPGADMWSCTTCGYEWTVVVEEAYSQQLVGRPGE